MNTKNQEKWISVALYYDNLELLLAEAAAPVAEEIIENGIASKFIFNRSWDRGKHLLLMFKTTQEQFTSQLKPRIEEVISAYFNAKPAPEKEIELPVNDWFLPFPNNQIQFNENFMIDVMETGGLQASLVAEDLLAESSNTIAEFIKASEGEWTPESGIGIAIQVHLGLVQAFGLSTEEIAAFYTAGFNNMLKITQGGDDNENFQANLIAGLDETFQEQKQSLVGFSDYILSTLNEGEEFEDEWFNNWVTIAKNGSQMITKLQSTGQYVTPESFEIDKTISVAASVQEKWPVMEYYLRAINCQLGITDIYELNLVYSLKESLAGILAGVDE